MWDRQTGQLVCGLDRGDDLPHVQRFGAAFVTVDGATVLVAVSDWNRLDNGRGMKTIGSAKSGRLHPIG